MIPLDDRAGRVGDALGRPLGERVGSPEEA